MANKWMASSSPRAVPYVLIVGKRCGKKALPSSAKAAAVPVAPWRRAPPPHARRAAAGLRARMPKAVTARGAAELLAPQVFRALAPLVSGHGFGANVRGAAGCAPRKLGRRRRLRAGACGLGAVRRQTPGTAEHCGSCAGRCDAAAPRRAALPGDGLRGRQRHLRRRRQARGGLPQQTHHQGASMF